MRKGSFLAPGSCELVEPLVACEPIGEVRRWWVARTGQTIWADGEMTLAGDGTDRGAMPPIGQRGSNVVPLEHVRPRRRTAWRRITAVVIDAARAVPVRWRGEPLAAAAPAKIRAAAGDRDHVQ